MSPAGLDPGSTRLEQEKKETLLVLSQRPNLFSVTY